MCRWSNAAIAWIVLDAVSRFTLDTRVGSDVQDTRNPLAGPVFSAPFDRGRASFVPQGRQRIDPRGAARRLTAEAVAGGHKRSPRVKVSEDAHANG